ncbi:hypothetical protein BN1195_02822 [Chryseobacterium oranimense G311]|nr:hypothetical protein BN1195_02822 [Chryseobacterium oranimense G311]
MILFITQLFYKNHVLFHYFFYNFNLPKNENMKKLILVRHAKSDWPEETEDFDRLWQTKD